MLLNMVCSAIFALHFFLVLQSNYYVSANSEQSPYCNSWKEDGSSTRLSDTLSRPTCAKPVELLYEGQLSSGISTKHADPLPPWFNATLFKIGQRFGGDNALSFSIGTALTFILYSAFPDTKYVLLSTGKTDTPAEAMYRYVMSGLHFNMYANALAQHNETISPYILESWYNVRNIHNRIANNIKDTPLPSIKLKSDTKPDDEFWDAVVKDLIQSNIPMEYRSFPENFKNESLEMKAMSHMSMLAAQWFVSASALIFPERIGIFHYTEEELWGWTHVWAVIGYALGMEDEYNIGLQPDLQAAKIYYKEIFNLYFIPALFNVDYGGKVLWESLFRMSDVFGPFVGQFAKKEHVMLIILERLVGVKAPNVRARLSRNDITVHNGLTNAISMLRYPTFRTLTSITLRIAIDNIVSHKVIAEQAYF